MTEAQAERLRKIYDRTDGHSHITGRKLPWSGYPELWEPDHLKPVADGGTNHLNNLRIVERPINRARGKRPYRPIRESYGVTRIPESRAQREAREARDNGIGTLIAVGGLAALLWWLGRQPSPAHRVRLVLDGMQLNEWQFAPDTSVMGELVGGDANSAQVRLDVPLLGWKEVTVPWTKVTLAP